MGVKTTTFEKITAQNGLKSKSAQAMALRNEGLSRGSVIMRTNTLLKKRLVFANKKAKKKPNIVEASATIEALKKEI
jgi:hypothetical protein